jgi:signal transduction histidine kinase
VNAALESDGGAEMRRVARTLAEVAHILTAADNPDQRVRAVLELLHNLVPYECCALLEAVPKHGRCEFLVVPELPPERRERLQTRLISLLWLMGGECESKKEEAPAGARPRGDDKRHLAIPVVGLNHVIGVLFVEQSGNEYNEHSLRLLTVVAAQLGSYLTTVRLREEEIEHARQLGIALHRLEETDRRKDEFLAMLGHELRNPLGAINNALRIIDGRSHEEIDRYHRIIDRQITHLSRIVDDLLDASRVRLGKVILERQLVDLKIVAQRWLDAFGTTTPVQSHQLHLDASDDPVVVEGDPIRLEQVFSNLLTNALKYTPHGGEIRVTVRCEGGEGVIRVRDRGIGIAPSVLSTVFDLFTQADDSLARSDGGLGLGLPLVRSLIEKHGGTVEAFSEGVGQGSEFVVRIPLASSGDALPRETSFPSAPYTGAPLRVLIIEDNDDAREMLSEMLSGWGYQVERARDGLQGVSLALAQPFDVLLVDIGLPKLDGYEVARQVRRELGTKGPTLWAMTGYGQPEDRRRAVDAGFEAHMVKPVNAIELQKWLSRVVPHDR